MCIRDRSTGALFLLVGMIYERRHTRLISEFGGLANRMPVYAGVFLFVVLSSVGLPGLNGFVGEFLVLLGTFAASKTYAVIAVTAVVMAAILFIGIYPKPLLSKIEPAARVTCVQARTAFVKDGRVLTGVALAPRS